MFITNFFFGEVSLLQNVTFEKKQSFDNPLLEKVKNERNLFNIKFGL